MVPATSTTIRSSLLKGVLLAALALASPAAAKDEAVAVGGRVLGTTGKALAGVTIELLAEPSGPAADRAAAPPVARAVTGSDGAFRLLAPEPGLWRVRVMAEGFPAMENPLHPLLEDVQLAPLTFGRTSSPEDAPRPWGWKPPARPGSRGTGAAASVSGRVVDALTGKPVKGAFVWPSAEPGALVRTADGGRFLAELPAGEPRFLQVAARGYLLTEREVPQGVPEAGEVRLQPAATVAGRVVDRAGRPVADAALRIAFGPRAVPGMVTYSRPDGSFLLGSVPPARSGELRAALDAAGRRLAGRHLLPALHAREKRQGLRLVLSASLKVVGRVVAVDGRGVAGARLRLTTEPPESGPQRALLDLQPAAEAHSRNDGSFELLDAGPGRFRLELESEGYLPPSLPKIELRETGGDVDLGNLVLRPSATLSGTVLQEGGAPVAAASVEARSKEEGGGPWQAESGVDGTFVLEALRPGARLEVSVRHPGFAPVVLPDVEVSPEPLEVVLHPGASLSGRVVDADGRGIGKAVLVVSAMPNPADAATAQGMAEKLEVEPDGRFTLPHLPTGTVSLRASAPGYRDAEIGGIEAAPGESLADVELVLEEAAVLAGSVRAPDGAPLPGAQVAVRSQEAEGGVLGTVMAGPDGAFRIEGLEPGPVEAEARHPRFRRAARVLDLSLGENRVELVLGQGLTVAGRVVDGEGSPVEGAEIGVEEVPGAPRSHSATSLADGSFRLTGLEPGRLTVTGRRDGFVPARLELELGAESIDGIVVRLERGGAIAGRLLGLSPSDLGRVEVVALAPGRGIHSGRTEPGGLYRIEGLLPGKWTVVASVASGERQARGLVQLGTGEEALDLDFGGGLRLSGRIRVDSRPLAGAEVTLLDLVNQGVAEARTGPGGEFEITGLEAGAYRLRFQQRASGLSHEQALELTGDRDLALDLASNRVSGHVLAADGSGPIAEARVTIEPLTGGQGAAAMTDSTGFFLLSLVPEGEYRLRVHKPGFSPVERSLSVAAGAATELSLLLSPG